MTSHDGSVEVKRINQLEFVMNNGIKLTFDKHYRSKKTDVSLQGVKSFFPGMHYFRDIPDLFGYGKLKD